MPAPVASLLRFASPTAPRCRLICFPFAGGGPATYRLWASSLPDVEVLVPPARRPGSEPLRSIHDVVASLLPAVEDVTDLPYALFGHSMGALVAFEMALTLEAGGGPAPAHLFVSGRRAPDDNDHPNPIRDLPDEQFLDELDRRYAAVPPAVRQERDLMAMLLPALRADVEALETYVPSSPAKVQCPVRAYGGLEDTHPHPDDLPAWQRVVERPLAVRLFPGDHFYLTTQRDALTADIRSSWDLATVPTDRR